MSRQRAIPNFILEGLVVVLSILVAFALDAWWDDSQTDRDVQEALSNISREVDANRSLLLFQEDLMARQVAASRHLVAQLEAADTSELIQVTDTLGWWAWLNMTFDPSFGATDALITSNWLGKLDSSELRLLLTGIKERVQDAVEGQHIVQALYDEALGPLVREATDNSRLAKVAGDLWTGDWVPGRELTSYGEVPYPNSLSVRNIIWERIVHQEVALKELAAVHADFDRVLALISDER